MTGAAPVEPGVRADFQSQGYVVLPDLLPEDLVAEAAAEAGRLFERLPEGTGAELTVYGGSDRPLERLARIDHPQLASPAIARLLRHPAFGRAAAALMGGEAVQAWYVHLSRKPPSNGSRAHIGWHQDGQYSDFMEGRFVTAWIPLTEIGEADSPLCYVPGSHRLGIVGGSGFSGQASPDELKHRLLERCDIDWSEAEVCARLGTVAMHDSLIIHGSHSNVGDRPRLALTVHLRSERNVMQRAPTYRLTPDHFRDADASPILLGTGEDFKDLGPGGGGTC